MDQAQSKGTPDNQNPQKLFCKQPITCPWITTQPYPSTMNKNRACDPTAAKSLPSIPLSMESRTINEKTCPSLQHSSSQFFYFLRLMQLFPETHPATLHTVLCLCKNDFFCAVDKLLYAKRCKALYSRSQGMFKRCSFNRSHPYCAYGSAGKGIGQQGKGNETWVHPNVKEFVDLHKGSDMAKAHTAPEGQMEVGEENNDIPLMGAEENESAISAPVVAAAVSMINNENNQNAVDDVTSPENLNGTQEINCDKAPEA